MFFLQHVAILKIKWVTYVLKIAYVIASMSKMKYNSNTSKKNIDRQMATLYATLSFPGGPPLHIYVLSVQPTVPLREHSPPHLHVHPGGTFLNIPRGNTRDRWQDRADDTRSIQGTKDKIFNSSIFLISSKVEVEHRSYLRCLLLCKLPLCLMNTII